MATASRPPSFQPGAVLVVSTVEGVLTIPGVLEADELDLASLATGGLLVLLSLVVALLATLRVGGNSTYSMYFTRNFNSWFFT